MMLLAVSLEDCLEVQRTSRLSNLGYRTAWRTTPSANWTGHPNYNQIVLDDSLMLDLRMALSLPDLKKAKAAKAIT